MRTQKVGVNIWKMMYSSCSYLVLAFFAYVLLKLVNACFWFPKHLQMMNKNKAKSNQNEQVEEKEKEVSKVDDMIKECPEEKVDEIKEEDKKHV